MGLRVYKKVKIIKEKTMDDLSIILKNILTDFKSLFKEKISKKLKKNELKVTIHSTDGDTTILGSTPDFSIVFHLEAYIQHDKNLRELFPDLLKRTTGK